MGDEARENADEHSLPGSNVDLYLGDPSKPLPNWRDFDPARSEPPDDGEATEAERATVGNILGLDLDELWPDEDEGGEETEDDAE